MKVLRENEVREDIAILHKAWVASESFVLLPEKISVSEKWLMSALTCVPEGMRQGHFIMLTSGTTGTPKLVIGNRVRSELLTTVLHEHQCSEPVSEAIVLLPLSYTYSFVNQWLWAMIHQRRLQITAGLSEPEALGKALSAATDAMVCLVGVQVPLLINNFSGECFPGVIRIHFAGGRFPQEQLTELQTIFPNAQVFNNYGCTEAMPRLTLRRAEAASEATDIGFPLPGIELKCSANNELIFRSPYGAVGVIEDGQFTAISTDDWITTGDLGEKTEQGSWRLLGRTSEVFKRHGEKVSLQSLTNTISAEWSGQCAFYRETDSLGEEGCVLTLAPVAGADELRSILLTLRKQHSRAQWPLRIEAVGSLPCLSNGKTDIRALRDVSDKVTLWQQYI